MFPLILNLASMNSHFQSVCLSQPISDPHFKRKKITNGTGISLYIFPDYDEHILFTTNVKN